jgi:hypothetical protein
MCESHVNRSYRRSAGRLSSAAAFIQPLPNTPWFEFLVVVQVTGKLLVVWSFDGRAWHEEVLQQGELFIDLH